MVKNVKTMYKVLLLGGILGLVIFLSCNNSQLQSQVFNTNEPDNNNHHSMKTDTATFGTGCFWCTEAVFQELAGVLKVTSGYSGGHVANPTYEQVCGKQTGHAEVVQIVYDPEKIGFDELLEVFWQVHDPTTKDRQGNDVGPQYRSAIFYNNDTQKELAEKYKNDLDKSGAYSNPIVTEISELKNFYSAEAYHQNFYSNNPNYGYCSYVIRPKLDKFQKVFKDKLRKNSPAN